jgi:non-ribosomal peptide synthetase-like protein
MTTTHEPAAAAIGQVGADELVLTAPGDQAIRWRPDDRLELLFERRCADLAAAGLDTHPAVDTGDEVLSYADLDARANRLARHLLACGVQPGDRVGLLLERSVRTYVAMLAVLKARAAYVPLDPAFPDDRIAYIVGDAGVRQVVTTSALAHRVELDGVGRVRLDDDAPAIDRRPGGRLGDSDVGRGGDDLCYIIYTSGSTGRPKGVAIDHPSICNFVEVAAETYGIRRDDRVYQGMTIAFDFSVEEIWVPLLCGATLVPATGTTSLVGDELHAFLCDRGVTALCCVPTLLATLDDDVPGLRFLLVSGEACPQELVARWHRPDRRFLNVYGPTEATVTATWTPLHPDEPVTIGEPLPTYAVVVLDPDEPRALPRGASGEIGIAGIGLARGYVNRDDLTRRAFIDDFLGIAGNASGRIYRTGDLGRVTDAGQVEYLGRIDTQVKVRGYRIELTEIESVLAGHPGVAQAVVDTHEPEPGMVELVAYYTLRRDAAADDVDDRSLVDAMRDRLPAYMVPSYVERLPHLPMLPSDKVDRKRLPPPTGARAAASTRAYVAPSTATEAALAAAAADLLGVERVSVDEHLFDELGANSLQMARFCARVRTDLARHDVAMKDVYLHPTVGALAAKLDADADAPTEGPVAPTWASAGRSTARARPWERIACGALQLLWFVLSALALSWLAFASYDYLTASADPVDAYVRSAILMGGLLVVFTLLPIAVKWLLVGRWTETEIRIWSLAYVRFWIAMATTRVTPVIAFAGTPLFPLYLRALGAKVGRGVVIFSRSVPACPDLVSIGDGTLIRADARLVTHRAEGPVIRTGRVTVGSDAYIGDAAVLDIDTTMGDRTQLGHASALHEGQSVPAGAHFHGSPGEPTDTSFVTVPDRGELGLRRIAYPLLVLLVLLFVGGPLGIAYVWLAFRLDVSRAAPASAFFVGSIVLGLISVLTVPRILSRLIEPGRVYPLFGIRFAIQRAIAGFSNSKFQNTLFGDSSYIVGYLRAVGLDLGVVNQTGSNFGVAQRWDSPRLCRVGSGTLVSDGLSIVNTDVSRTSFAVRQATIGDANFLGNAIVYPNRGTTGDDCLLATKVMVPVDGPPREGVGLLGSPSFEIPRSVFRDTEFAHYRTGELYRTGLRRKNRSNVLTMALFVVTQFVVAYVSVVIGVLAVRLGGSSGPLALAAGLLAIMAWAMASVILMEWLTLGFTRLRPRTCSILQPPYWRHERYWKLADPTLIGVLNGTPFKPFVWRMLGVRVGRRLYDGGCALSERSLVEIGDDCTINEGVVLQGHSLEDAVFKSDRIRIGRGSTIGPGCFVHYGVTVGDDVTLAVDSFLMKGETTGAHEHWGGNPARRRG